MDADERLTALKKAYAEIILNTAKEAAARIMVSERKALRFQHELYAAKEEALQMLLRLKQMMDSKISEAEMTSFSQQKKIEELEAQLQEAEDIVKDLREELRQVQAVLEREQKKEVKHQEHEVLAPLERPEDNSLSISQSIPLPPSELRCEFVPASDIRNLNLDKTNEGQKLYNSLVHMGNSYVGNPDLPSIILRSKEPELYRNGCTQRIRACERTPLDRELSTVKEDGEGKMISKVLTSEADTMCNIKKNEVSQEDSRISSWFQVRIAKSLRSCRKRKRATRFKRNRISSCLYQQDQVRKTHQAPDVSYLTKQTSAEDVVEPEKDLVKMAQKVSSEKNGRGMEPGCAETLYGDADFIGACGVQSTLKRSESFRDELVPIRQENQCPESSVCHLNLEKVDVPIVNSESEVSNTTSRTPIQPVNDRIIKYTFQRKRRREPLSSPDANASTEKNTFKRTEVEKENGSLDLQKSSFPADSSRDSRRLAQVARQLISLSEKKWWQ